MAKTISISEKQLKQFNTMLLTLNRICKEYSSPSKLMKNSNSGFGLDYEEALEMAYENIQLEARHAVKGVQKLEIES